MNWPIYSFDEETDYATVLITVQRMYSYLNTQVGCCKGKSIAQQMCNVDRILQAISIDGSSNPDLFNEDRWKVDIEAAYEILYKLV